MTRSNSTLIVSILGLVLSLTLVLSFAVGSRRPANELGVSVQPAAYYDLNKLTLYRASEWGQPAPAAVQPATWYDLSQYHDYWQGEHELAPEWRLAPDRLYHDLLIVK